MRLAPDTRRKRAGFTLLEILVVVVIILILAGLISGAAMRALSKAREVRNASDIRQLTGAVENFKGKFGFYPPSRLKICERYMDYNLSNPLDVDSIQVLTRMFPRIDIQRWTAPGIDWDGSGNYTQPGVLQGQECLVFFLGGIPGPGPQCLGFSTNPQDPGAATSDRIGPFYEFQQGRLGATAGRYYSYLDAYGSLDSTGAVVSGNVYAYFSSYKSTNGYNRYSAAFGNSDCWSLLPAVPGINPVGGVWPYLTAPGQYANPNSFQIVSAGKNGIFGPGSVTPTTIWTPATASTFYVDGPILNALNQPLPPAGRDDQSNFYDSPLGIESR
jgi:general secretion pathway protein G